MKRVLFFGGRDYKNKVLAFFYLDKFHSKYGISCVIQGCARGADTICGEWADARNIDQDKYPADWEKHGKAAGPIRNLKMRDEGKPDVGIGFPGGSGTAHMARSLKEKGIPVIEIKEPKVLNKKIDGIPEKSIYIGRPSIWQNPYIIGKDFDRDDVCNLFEKHTLPRLDLKPLLGYDLVCHCAPKRCHGHSIIRQLYYAE